MPVSVSYTFTDTDMDSSCHWNLELLTDTTARTHNSTGREAPILPAGARTIRQSRAARPGLLLPLLPPVRCDDGIIQQLQAFEWHGPGRPARPPMAVSIEVRAVVSSSPLN
jgi:hypothetical protein